MTTQHIAPDSIWIEKRDYDGDKSLLQIFMANEQTVMFTVTGGRNAGQGVKSRRAWNRSAFLKDYEPYVKALTTDERIERLEKAVDDLAKSVWT